ncbi:MAG TPA: paraquat-inducible protein A, partial [Acetobacteraceae bacterium]|nr:paraquat-inducible protein A [Acetobacteraceae bacterium]
ETGRWSETGPLSIMFYVPLIDFGRLGAESAGWGATAFIIMTLLVIAAAVTFDSRVMWDAAARTGITERAAGGAHERESESCPDTSGS